MNLKQHRLVEAWILSSVFFALLLSTETKFVRYAIVCGGLFVLWLLKNRYAVFGKMKPLMAYINDSKAVRYCLLTYFCVVSVLAYGSIYSGVFLQELNEGHRLFVVFVGPLLPLVVVQQLYLYARLGRGC